MLERKRMWVRRAFNGSNRKQVSCNLTAWHSKTMCASLCPFPTRLVHGAASSQAKALICAHSTACYEWKLKKPNGLADCSFFRFELLSWRAKPYVYNHAAWNWRMNQPPLRQGEPLCLGCVRVVPTAAGQLFSRLVKTCNQLFDSANTCW